MLAIFPYVRFQRQEQAVGEDLEKLSQSLISLCERLLTERPAPSTFNLKVE